ncbi:protein EURL homolog isoform X1 [Paramormyrops kingsleyae]
MRWIICDEKLRVVSCELTGSFDSVMLLRRTIWGIYCCMFATEKHPQMEEVGKPANFQTYTMNEGEQFVNIDLNDDLICSVCKLETDTGTLSFCHICFELSIEGVTSSALLHSKSLRGHRDCFEKYHLIANQKLSRTKVSRSTYEGVKNVLSQKISRIIQYAQNKDGSADASRRGVKHQLLCCSQQGDRKLVPRTSSHVPRYAPRWEEGAASGVPDHSQGILRCHSAKQLGLSVLEDEGAPFHPGAGLWPMGKNGVHRAQQQGSEPAGVRQRKPQGHSQEELNRMSVDELCQLKGQLRLQLQKVFEELTTAVQEKDSLTSELHVRHIAIEQLFKNCGKLPWLQVGRAGVKASNTPTE